LAKENARAWRKWPTAPSGASAVLRSARLLGRNFPLVLMMMIIGALFWPTEQSKQHDEDIEVRKPNGSDHVESSLRQ